MVNLVTEVEGQAVSGIAVVEDLALSVVSGFHAMSDRFAEFVPELPTLPFAELIPAPRDVVRSGFTVAERVLEAQRKVSEGVVDAIAPITGRLMPWTTGRRGPARQETKPSSQTKSSQAA